MIKFETKIIIEIIIAPSPVSCVALNENIWLLFKIAILVLPITVNSVKITIDFSTFFQFICSFQIFQFPPPKFLLLKPVVFPALKSHKSLVIFLKFSCSDEGSLVRSGVFHVCCSLAFSEVSNRCHAKQKFSIT